MRFNITASRSEENSANKELRFREMKMSKLCLRWAGVENPVKCRLLGLVSLQFQAVCWALKSPAAIVGMRSFDTVYE